MQGRGASPRVVRSSAGAPPPPCRSEHTLTYVHGMTSNQKSNSAAKPSWPCYVSIHMTLFRSTQRAHYLALHERFYAAFGATAYAGTVACLPFNSSFCKTVYPVRESVLAKAREYVF